MKIDPTLAAAPRWTRRRWLWTAAAGLAAKTAPPALLAASERPQMSSHFGLSGTSRADQSEAIGVAIAALSEGETLVFAPGVYRVERPVVVTNRRGIGLRAAAGASFIAPKAEGARVPGFSRVLFLFEDCAFLRLDSLVFDMRGSGCGAVCLVRCSGAMVSGCEMSGSAGLYQIGAISGTGNSFVANYVHDSRQPARGMWIGNIHDERALETDVVIRGNRAIGNAASGIVCCGVGATVMANRSYGNAGSGIVFSGANGRAARKVRCSDNQCEANAFHGVQSDVVFSRPEDHPSDVEAVGNTCVRNAMSGIYAVHVTRWQILENNCSDNGQRATGDGIVIGRAHGVVVSRNRCANSGTERSQRSGIRVVAEAGYEVRDVAVRGNLLARNHEAGISILNFKGEGMTAISVAGNSSSENPTGIEIIDNGLVPSIDAQVSGNVIVGSSKLDIRVRGLGVKVLGNDFQSAK